MIKTILVPSSGYRSDESVFATALALGRPFAAHLQFLHVHMTAGSAALHSPHLEFASARVMSDALGELQRLGANLSSSALRHVENFCAANRLLVRDTPGAPETVSASWCEETDQPVTRLLFHARHSDLVVLGRPRNRDYMPHDLIEALLLGAGRPIVIAPSAAPRTVGGTIVVGWKETAPAARAVAAALPLLKRADRVVLLAIAEGSAAAEDACNDLARQLAWHGINAQVSTTGDASRPVAPQLAQTVAGLQADLLVVGGFGRTPLRESILGGVTQSLMEHCDVPVFMVH
jgi:nucleotide-binding universal stress UspA family protein